MDPGVVQASTRGSSHPVHRENRRRSSTTTEPHINQRGKKTFVEAIQIEIFKCSILKTPRGVYHAHKQFCLHSLFLCVSSRPRQHVEGISRHQGGKMCRLNVFKICIFSVGSHASFLCRCDLMWRIMWSNRRRASPPFAVGRRKRCNSLVM